MDDQDDRPRESQVDELPEGFGFDGAAEEWAAQLLRAEAPIPGAHLGPYELVEEVSRGGQGVVYRALERGTGRRVALKRLLGGAFASASARRRFEHEIEALRALDHPHVVSGLALEIVDGAPLLVMEWIDGVPINEWARADPTRRSPAAVVRLVQAVCAAVQHAHQHGVLHRDLKPSNILIDAAGEPHVIDFGLAKLGSLEHAEDSAATRTGRFLGTVSYASLEQLYGSVRDVDVRSDIHALGVILYELLTGELPYGRGLSAAALARAMEEAKPARAPLAAAGVQRDLQAIVSKALAPTREARYQSVDALAADLRRFLAGEPVEARAPGGLARWIAALAARPLAVGLAGLLLVASAVLAALFAHLARAHAEQRDAALEAGARAAREAAKARAINDFLNRMLSAPRPGKDGADVRVRELLDEAVRALGSGLEEEPLVEAELRNTLGMTYHQLGLLAEAEQELRAALRLQREHGEDADLAVVLNNLGNLLGARGGYGEARTLLDEALALRRRRYGEAHVLVAQSWNNLGALELRAGRHDEALALFRRGLDVLSGADSGDRALLATGLNNLAKVLEDEGRVADAEAVYREALAAGIEALGASHPDSARIMANLAECLARQGELDEAEELLLQAAAIQRAAAGEHHPDYAFTLDSLCGLAFDRGELGAAEAHARESLEIRTSALGGDHAETAISLSNLARVLMAAGMLDEAAGLLERALDTAERTLPRGHWHLATYHGNYGECLGAIGAFEAAEAELALSHALFVEGLGEEHPSTREAARKLAGLYRSWGKPERAAEWSSRSSVTGR
jgi:tetratricopeptide (TPR) repeat protein